MKLVDNYWKDARGNKWNSSKYSEVQPVNNSLPLTHTGITSSNGTDEITTPAACVLICLFKPSNL